MSWEAKLQPNLVLGESIVSLTPDILQEYDLKGLVLDVDETLVPFREQEVSPEVAQWVEEIRDRASLWLVSNNLSENRIGSIARALNLPYIIGARKPSRRKLRQAVVQMQLPVQRVAMVGDRLFTDVLAANRLGMFSILVEPMVDPTQLHSYSLRNFEVQVSQWLGVTLSGK
ncbi:MAG: YqeG family HAD IIIA-type phosphatase [Cyanobacteriota bacterium]|nr:YqeG family HAD IIIA-type phosphatase [Cyanobacteriota bacterium]